MPLSPIDLIPEFLPVIGPLDDVVVVALCLRYSARRLPGEILVEAWPGDPATLPGCSVTAASSAMCHDPTMIIVSGALYVDEADRERYLLECHDVITAARGSEGCIDFHLAADPIEPDRINVYEQWESSEAVDAFRGSGPSAEQTAAIRDARVFQHEIASSVKL